MSVSASSSLPQQLVTRRSIRTPNDEEDYDMDEVDVCLNENNLICTCCCQRIKGQHPLNYNTYASYYKQIFPQSRPGKVCINCYHACKKFMADTNHEYCSCCEGSIGTNPTHYSKYDEIYSRLFPGSPFGGSTGTRKVCQNCTKIARLALNNENRQYCSCCQDQLGTTPSLYSTHADIYKKLFPDSPVGNSSSVCDKCYRKAQQVKRQKEGELCACCNKNLGRNPTLYANYSEYYKELYPDSPVGTSKRVCQNCYGRAQQLKNDKEGNICACCQRTAGRNPTSYDTQAQYYKKIFPYSPHHSAKLVCTSCYQKAWRLKKKSNEQQQVNSPVTVTSNNNTSRSNSKLAVAATDLNLTLPPKQRMKNEIKTFKRHLSPVDVELEPDTKRNKLDNGNNNNIQCK
jgi:hypothetical protein